MKPRVPRKPNPNPPVDRENKTDRMYRVEFNKADAKAAKVKGKRK